MLGRVAGEEERVSVLNEMGTADARWFARAGGKVTVGSPPSIGSEDASVDDPSIAEA